ncbi:MAG: divalent-cation tolerance protein CutA [Gemmatimonadetes bacterium]|nr:divalent-cation tolerance protein CutA [Gemmatimonadota bacterium]
MSATVSTQVVTLLTAAPGLKEAERIALALVSERLAACANVIPGVSSIYWWDGQVQREEEAMVVIKTTMAQVNALEARLVELHPYDIPELLVFPIAGGHPPYLAWVGSEVEG